MSPERPRLSPAEAEQLLGGHAAGILTEAEQSALFAAALDHQEVFDALMDEEALRELLADPEARKALLAALSEAPPVPIRPLWRRPAFLAAASLLLVTGTSLVLWKQEGATAARQILAPTQDKADQAPKTQAAPQPLAKEKQAVESEKAELGRNRVPAQTPAAAEPAKPASEARSGRAKDEASGFALSPAEERPKEEDRLRAAPGAAAKAQGGLGGAAPVAAPSPVVAASADMQERREAKKAAPARLAEQASGKLEATTPTWRLEPLDGGRLRLHVSRTSGHLYLVGRSAEGVRNLRPDSERTEGSVLHSRFDLGPRPGEAFDLYVLPQTVPDPRTLPAEGPVSGWRVRVRN